MTQKQTIAARLERLMLAADELDKAMQQMRKTEPVLTGIFLADLPAVRVAGEETEVTQAAHRWGSRIRKRHAQQEMHRAMSRRE
jgi:cell division protein ZapA (FtsZ GTPase activity inhibitor)